MKAKQKIALFLAIFYMAAVMGLAFNLHFCGGKLDSLALYNATVSCKMCSKMAVLEKDNSCCKDTKVDIKLKDNHQGSVKTELSKSFEYQLSSLIYAPSPKLTITTRKAIHQSGSPPELNYPPINILHCTFRI